MRHFRSKNIFPPGNEFRQRDAGVIAGLNNDAIEEFVNRYGFADLDKHSGTFHFPGFLTNGSFLFQIDRTFFQCIRSNIYSHYFCQTGRVVAFVGIEFGKRATGRRFYQDIRLGT